MAKSESDKAFLVRVFRSGAKPTKRDLVRLSCLAALSPPGRMVARRSYAAEGRALAGELKALLDQWHELPMMVHVDPERFLEVCLGLACDARAGFDASDDVASSGKEARDVLKSIFRALVHRRGRAPSRERAKLEYERKLDLGLGDRHRQGKRRSPAVEFFSAVLDLLNGDQRPSKARGVEAAQLVTRCGFGGVVKRLLREKPQQSEWAARREATTMTRTLFGVAPAALRKRRERDRCRT